MIPRGTGPQKMYIYLTMGELTDAILRTPMEVPDLEKARGIHLNLTHFLSKQ